MKKKDKNALKYISRVSGKTKIHIVTLLLMQIILGMSSVFYALLFRDVIDSAVSHDRNGMIKSILFLVGLTLFLIVLRAVVRFVQEYASAGFENAFKNRLFSTLLSKDYGSVSEVHSGEWVNRLTSDTAVIAEGLSSILPGMGEMLARMLGSAVMILVIEPFFGLILIPGGGILVILTFIFRRRLKKLHKKVQETDGKVRVFFQEHLESLVIIKSYSAEKKSVRSGNEKMKEHKRARIRKNHFSNICNIGFASAMNGAFLLGIVYGAFGILNNTVSYGTLMALLQLIGQIQAPFANISGYLPKYYAMIASAERLMEAEGFPNDNESKCGDTVDGVYADKSISAGKNPGMDKSWNVDENKNAAKNGNVGENISGSPVECGLWQEEGNATFTELGLKGVAFSYKNGDKGETQVLDNFDFFIRKGEFVAFTGESGCGKSTVLKLLMGLYPISAGERFVKTGENNLSFFRHLFAYVPQGNYLMSGSIREIVTFGDKDVKTQKSGTPGVNSDRNTTTTVNENKSALGQTVMSAPIKENTTTTVNGNEKVTRTVDSDERLKRALEISCASAFVAGLSDGVDTILGERGAGLSEGQMQRIAVARAIYSERPILLLDEATSALDAQTEEELLTNLRTMTDKTVIIVTHRQAALAVCDRQVEFTKRLS